MIPGLGSVARGRSAASPPPPPPPAGPVYVGAASAEVDPGPLDITNPGAATDFLVAAVTATDPVATPSGWTLNFAIHLGGGDILRVFSRPGSADATYSFGDSDVSNLCGGILAFTSSNGTPVETSDSATGSSSTDVVAPSVTSALSTSIMVTVHATARANATFTPPTGMIERVDIAITSGLSVEICTRTLTAAGATGTKTATASNPEAWAAASLIIR